MQSTEKLNSTTPQHIGIIMDGNRRWARAQGLNASAGHLQAYKNLRDLAMYALLEKKIPFLSVFAFSTENWSRAEEEVGFLMGLALRAMDDYLDEFHEAGIRIVVLGSREKLEPKVIKAIETAETKTQGNQNGTLAICFNYGGQQEIADACKRMLQTGVDPDTLTTDVIAQHLYHPEVPPVDLLVRTSGELRTSGYMLWRSAYAELKFLEKFWPEVTTADIDAVLQEYAQRQRRFGA